MYIQYTMDQLFLPMDLQEDIPQNHLVRLVNAAVNRLDDAIFDAAYPGVVDVTATTLKCLPKSSFTPTLSEFIPPVKLHYPSEKTFRSCGWLDDNVQTFAQ
ncbi:hypothetical protein J2T13_004086 [Paenibacillus sp. DS2015]